ncbi:MAG: hypothetical protein M1822_006417 [Bathelium mastoideum]|nr:MAG: hypothetical protein M1822_006417 [Bathelium mastoideum]
MRRIVWAKDRVAEVKERLTASLTLVIRGQSASGQIEADFSSLAQTDSMLNLNEASLESCLLTSSALYTFQAFEALGDIVLLRPKLKPSTRPLLTKPLRKDVPIYTSKGVISQSQIIGARVRDVIRSHTQNDFRIHEPTLAEYVSLTPRIVTPIYPGDASLIVSLLDIHVSAPGADQAKEPPLEILEAGTGHGSLTLHLARAIHGANSLPPDISPLIQATTEDDSKTADDREDSGSDSESSHSIASFDSPFAHVEDSFNHWKQSRRAILHTLDVSRRHSRHAEKIVRNFRRGIYAGDVDFHVGDVSEWITAQLASRQHPRSQDSDTPTTLGNVHPTPFLSHALLDLPSADDHLSAVASALRLDGMLTVFNPSITQIIDCVERINAERLPLILDRVIELESSRSEGKVWDVKPVRTRVMEKRTKASEGSESELKQENTENDGQQSDSELEEPETTERDDEQTTESERRDREYVMVCRPKVGEKIVGGGFLGIWRKMNCKA